LRRALPCDVALRQAQGKLRTGETLALLAPLDEAQQMPPRRLMAQGFESKGCGALQRDRIRNFKAASQRPARRLFEIRPAS